MHFKSGEGHVGGVFECFPKVHMDGDAGVARWNSLSLPGRGSATSSLAPATTRRIKVLESLVGAKVPPRGSCK